MEFKEKLKIVLKRITNILDPMYYEALKLYQISFPHHEQRERHSQNEIIKDHEYHFNLIYDEEVFVGLILYWEQEQFIYIEHFCILPEMRNKQYGDKTLALLAEQGKTTILEIDPPKDSISNRRKGFYERCGFVENFFTHIHPPYHSENKGHHLVIMTSPNQISKELFDTFSHYLKNRVMNHI